MAQGPLPALTGDPRLDLTGAEKTLICFVPVCFVLLILLLWSSETVYYKQNEINELKADAVRRGHAEFYLTADKPTPLWRWKVEPEAKP